VFATQGITVSGEVNAPGIYSLVGPHRLYDAISAAGGITAKAGPTVTIVHAGQPDLPEIVTLPGRTFDLHTNVMIFPGDTVIVSKAGIVYVVGEVSRPGGFLMENNTTMSLLNAIALAQGTTKFASLKHVFLIRKSPEGSLQIELSLDKIYHGESSDIRLKADDVLFVPTSNWKTYGPLGIQGAIQAAVYSAYAIELRP
jgi:polysaccharide export outer membrane protein